MALDSMKIGNMSYDSTREVLQFQITGLKGGKNFNLFGSTPVATPGDQTESAVRDASKAALAQLLRDVADSL